MTFKPYKKLEIKIKQRACTSNRECKCLAGPLVSGILGEEYSVWERHCQLEEGLCSYSMTPAGKFEIKTSVCKLPMAGNEFSGDNHALVEMKDGHFAAILSDGMGHGKKAALESNITVSVLERLLKTGIDHDFAVKMVNSVLLLHSPEESFATIDLALINLHNAKAEFIKIGAAATFIKRDSEVWSINSTSFPVGILNAVDAERTRLDLQADDLIIMVSDGVIDSKSNQVGKEEWLIRALSQVEVAGPEALGEYLLNLALHNQEGKPKDDLTIIVLQVTRKNHFR